MHEFARDRRTHRRNDMYMNVYLNIQVQQESSYAYLDETDDDSEVRVNN